MKSPLHFASVVLTFLLVSASAPARRYSLRKRGGGMSRRLRKTVIAIVGALTFCSVLLAPSALADAPNAMLHCKNYSYQFAQTIRCQKDGGGYTAPILAPDYNETKRIGKKTIWGYSRTNSNYRGRMGGSSGAWFLCNTTNWGFNLNCTYE
jgi:hypothetical protein